MNAQESGRAGQQKIPDGTGMNICQALFCVGRQRKLTVIEGTNLGNFFIFRLRSSVSGCQRGEHSRSLRLKDVRIDDRIPFFCSVDRDDGCGKRSAAELKEVSCRADFFHAQHFGEPSAEILLDLVCRFHIFRFIRDKFHLRQLFLIDLSVLGKRHGLQLHQHARHHIRCQCLADLGLQLFRRDLPSGRVVSGKKMIILLSCHDNDTCDHTRNSVDGALDLTELYSEASQLHLIVSPAAEADPSVRSPFGDVTGPIGLTPLINEKLLRRQVGPSDVPSAYPASCDDQLTGDQRRQDISLFIHDIRFHIGGRPPDRDQTGIGHLVHGAADGRFCRTVPVHDVSVRIEGCDLIIQCCREGFCPDIIGADIFQSFLHDREFNAVREEGRRAGHHIHLIVRHEFRQRGGIMDLFLCRHADRHSVRKRNKFFHDGYVKCNSGKSQRYMGLLGISQDLRILLVGIQEIEQVALREHDSLGLSGGAGSENTVSQIVLFGRKIGIIHTGIAKQLLHRDNRAGERCKELLSLLRQLFRHDKDSRLCILRHHPDAVVGIIGSDGQEGSPCLQDTLPHHVDLLTARQHQGYNAAGRAEIDQRMRDAVGALVQLSVRQPVRGGDHSKPVGIVRGIFLHQAAHRTERSGNIRIVDRIQESSGVRGKQLNIPQAVFLHQSGGDHRVDVGHPFHLRLRVHILPIFKGDLVRPVLLPDIDTQGLLGVRERLRDLDRFLPCQGETGKAVALISKEDIGIYVVIPDCLGEGVKIVCGQLLNTFLYGEDEIDRFLRSLCTYPDGIRFYQHTHDAKGLNTCTPVINGCEQRLVAVRKP